MERSVRITRNALLNVVAFLYPAALAIVITPVVLHFVGTAAYGIYALSVAFISILGLLEFGAGIALLKYLPEHIVNGDEDAVNEVMQSGVALYGLLALTGAVISFAVAPFSPDLFDVSGSLSGESQRAFVIGGVGFALTVLANVFGSALGALQRFDITTGITLIATTVATATTVVLLVLGAGLDGLMVGIALQPAVDLVLSARSVKKRLPYVRFTPKWHPENVRRLATLSAYVLIGNVSGLVLFQFDKFYLGVINGATAVAFYVVPGALASRLHSAASSLTSVSLPAASELFAQGDFDRARTLYRRATWLTTLILASIAVPAMLFSEPLLHYWVGGDFPDKSTTVLQILIATYLLLSMSAIPYWFAMASGHLRSTGVFNGATAVINVVAILILVPRHGLIGAAVAYLVSMVTVPCFVWYAERRVLQLQRTPWLAIGWRLGIGVAVQVAVCLALRGLAHDLAATVGLVLVCIAVAPAVLFALRLIEVEDRMLLSRVLHRQGSA